MPLANSYVRPEHAGREEPSHPLHARVCDACLLVQVGEFATPGEIFGDYAYLSSVSQSWLDHCRTYAHGAIERFGLGGDSLVVEVASNDGYLLRWFREQGVPVLGIEPAVNVAEIARERGVPTVPEFFGTTLATRLLGEGRRADLLVANNVLAHVPDLNDFVRGMSTVLADDGVITIEFPHLLQLIEHSQFDTVYHEHFSYFSLHVAIKVLAAAGLTVFDVDRLPTHGGSLRVYAAHEGRRATRPAVAELLEDERRDGLHDLATYRAFQHRVGETKAALLAFLQDSRERGLVTVGYGAPAKGNTLLNTCGIGPDLLPWTVDMNELKQGTLLPGSRIPVHTPDRLRAERPDQVLILPWNIAGEIVDQHAYVTEWGGRFFVPIPRPREIVPAARGGVS